MQTIGVLVHTLALEYATDIINGIIEYCKDRDIHVVVGQIKNPHNTIGMYDYQHWAGAELFFSKQVDGIIVLTGGFTSYMKSEELAYYLNRFSQNQPVVSIATDLDVPNSVCLKTDCSKAYDDIVHHLKKVHKCQNIAYFSAIKTNSIEAQERYQEFIKAMDKNKMKYDASYFFHGDFNTKTAHDLLLSNFKSANDFPFDAIVCANDLVAIGCVAALKEIGLSVPKDVKVIGFDDTSKSYLHNPRLSTINQKLFEQGRTAAQCICKKLKSTGKKIPKQTIIEAEPIYRQSCGCIDLDNNDTVFMDGKGRFRRSKADQQRNLSANSKYFNILSDIDNLNTIFDMVHSTTTLEVFSYTLKYILESTQMASIFIALYDRPIKFMRQDKIELPENVDSVIYVNAENGLRAYNKYYSFNPKETLVPEEFKESGKGVYILQPIFSGELNYGYLVCRSKNENFELNTISLKIIANAITQSYEYSHKLDENKRLFEANEALQADNSDLTLQTQTDELTGLLNRRGFMEFGSRTINMASEMNSSGLLFFADLDGLKKINDTYGHKMGDNAIKAMAEVFTGALRTNDIIARISGDEFAAIAVGMNHNYENTFREKLNKLCEAVGKQRNFPFTLSCSFGSVEFDSQHANIKDLLMTADERLYIEKRNKKAAAK